MTLQTGAELVLAVGAAGVLIRDVGRSWRDRLRRPVTLLVPSLLSALLIGVAGGRAHPDPWWLLLPAGMLTWEVVRGWRRAPRCHLWEAGVGAFAASLLLSALALGLGNGRTAPILLGAAVGLAGVAVGLLWGSHRREPPPSRPGDVNHYERRSMQRPAR